MSVGLEVNDRVVERLPLPLAQAARGVPEGRNALDRQLCAFFVWESGLKLLASVAIIEIAERGTADPAVVELLNDLAHPSLGHWWGFARRLTSFLADAGDRGFCQARDVLFSSSRDSLPRAAGLFCVLEEFLGGSGIARNTVVIGELFDRLVRYRNREIGHGATGRQTDAFYDRVASAMLAGVLEVFGELDVLAGRRLHYIGDVRRHSSGEWLADCFELIGDRPRRTETLSIPSNQPGLVPNSNQVYLRWDAATSVPGASMQSLSPLVLFRHETKEFFFFNSRRGKKNLEYLCLTTGRVLKEDYSGDRRSTLAVALELPAARETEGPEVESRQSDVGEAVSAQGQTIGEYELISELGRGGMGIVYRAWQPSLGRQVALKRMFKLGDPVADRRFAREIHALARVEHPNVVKALTSGSHGDQWFLVMELVDGADLTTVSAQLNQKSAADIDDTVWATALTTACDYSRSLEKPLTSTRSGERSVHAAVNSARGKPSVAAPPPNVSQRSGRAYIRRIVEIMQKVSDAAHAIHEAGIIHRDIKPGNIRITPSGEPVLMDLGIAQLVDESEGRLTKTRQNVGTLRYMSPEQMLAVGKVDRRADVYSLGATLWELLTLHSLFDATDDVPDAEVMQRIQIAEPTSPRRHNPSVPKDLEAVVLKCLEKDRARRYATAADLALDLQRFIKGEPVAAQPPSLSYLASKFVRRHRWRLATAAAVLALLVGAAVASFVSTLAANHRILAVNHRLEEDAYVKNVAVAERELSLNQDYDLALDLLNNCPPRLRGWEWRYLMRYRNDGGREPLVGHEKGLWMADFSPDGKRVATCSTDGTIKMWDAATGKMLKDIDAQPEPVLPEILQALPVADILSAVGTQKIPIMCVAYSPDGRFIASGSFAPAVQLDFSSGYRIDAAKSPGVVSIWNADTGQKVADFRDQYGVVMALTYSPDGKQIASSTINPENTFVVWDAATLRVIKVVAGHKGTIHRLRYSADGRYLVSGDTAGQIKFWDAKTFQEIRSIDAHSAPIRDIAFSPDGARFATAGEDGNIRVWETETGKNVREQKGHIGAALAVCYSPDGSRIASAGFDKTVRIWDADTGQEELTLRGHTQAVWSVVFSPNGNSLLSAGFDKTARIWDATPVSGMPSGVISTLAGHTDRVNVVSYSKDGRYLATSSWDKDVRLWDAQTGKALYTFHGHAGPVWGIAFSPDGSKLASASWDCTVKLWNTATGQLTSTFKAHTGPAHAVAFSDDGKKIYSGDFDGQVKVWDPATGKVLANCDGFLFPIFAVAPSPDGRFVATGGADGKINLFDANTGRKIRTLGSHAAAVYSLAYAKDGKSLVSASWDQTLKIWNLEPPETNGSAPAVITLEGHSDLVNGVAISPDGSLIASACQDKMVRLWDAKTGKEKFAPLHHPGFLWSVAFSPDGKRLTSACWCKSAWIWTWDTSKFQSLHP